MVDAWVIGNFADNDAFAAVSSTGTVVFLIIGFFCRHCHRRRCRYFTLFWRPAMKTMFPKAVHTNFPDGADCLRQSARSQALSWLPIFWYGLAPRTLLCPMPLRYLQIYFGGVSTVIMYNICMSIMRALGDSIHPLYYLLFSSIVNILSGSAFCGPSRLSLGRCRCCCRNRDLSGVSALFSVCFACVRLKDYTRFGFPKKSRYHSHG